MHIHCKQAFLNLLYTICQSKNTGHVPLLKRERFRYCSSVSRSLTPRSCIKMILKTNEPNIKLQNKYIHFSNFIKQMQIILAKLF